LPRSGSSLQCGRCPNAQPLRLNDIRSVRYFLKRELCLLLAENSRRIAPRVARTSGLRVGISTFCAAKARHSRTFPQSIRIPRSNLLKQCNSSAIILRVTSIPLSKTPRNPAPCSTASPLRSVPHHFITYLPPLFSCSYALFSTTHKRQDFKFFS